MHKSKYTLPGAESWCKCFGPNCTKSVPFPMGLLQRTLCNRARGGANFSVQTMIINQVLLSLCCWESHQGPGWWVLQTDCQDDPALASWCSWQSPLTIGRLASVAEALSFEVQERLKLENWLCDWTWENYKTLWSFLICKWGYKSLFHRVAECVQWDRSLAFSVPLSAECARPWGLWISEAVGRAACAAGRGWFPGSVSELWPERICRRWPAGPDSARGRNSLTYLLDKHSLSAYRVRSEVLGIQH